MYLSKSKYCKGVQCKKILWLDENKPEEMKDVENDNVLENGTNVGEVAKKLLGPYVDIKFCEDLKTMINDTKALLGINNIVITEASFNYNNNFCSVDILKKNGNDYEIYEVKSSTSIHEIYYDDISYQYYVLSSLGMNVVKCNIVYVNNTYVRDGELEVDKLFNICDVTSIVLSKQNEVLDNINEIEIYMKEDMEPNDKVDYHCINPYTCPYFEYCTRKLEKPNVFDLTRITNKNKFKLLNEGIYKYEDLLNSDIDSKCIQQIEYELYDKDDYVDKDEIKSFLDTLSYPLYFLDFETYQQSIPLFDGVKPYMQIPFQYSLHYILEEDGILEHKEYLAQDGVDPRRELAESLVRDIPMNVCTLAYNMSFEKTVVKNLLELFPDLSEHLMNIHDNMYDLMIPFKNRYYYNKDMKGSYSIKYVLPALFPDEESLNYHNLDGVHNGSEAMSSFANLFNLDTEEKDKVRYNLLRYCELDTYAMVKIWEKLRECVK